MALVDGHMRQRQMGLRSRDSNKAGPAFLSQVLAGLRAEIRQASLFETK